MLESFRLPNDQVLVNRFFTPAMRVTMQIVIKLPQTT